MAFATAFSEAFINSRVRVLGKVLQPFSLRHLLWLASVDSPFAKLVEAESIDVSQLKFHHLRVFVAICSSKNDDEVWKNLYSRLRFRGRFAWSRNAAWVGVMAYIRDFVTSPHILSTAGKERSLGGPWLVRLVAILCKNGFGTAEQVWNLPLGQALWYSAALAEVDGMVTLGDKEYEEFLARKAEKAKLKKSECLSSP